MQDAGYGNTFKDCEIGNAGDVGVYRPPGVTISFQGGMVLRRPQSETYVDIKKEPHDFPFVIRDGHSRERMFPLPMPGRFWLRRFYDALCWYLGRRGR
jgi:hypothetical protein